MATRIKLRRDTAANWLDANPILANGETAVETDTRRLKVGDGVTAWKALAYAVTGDLRIDGTTINTEMGAKITTQDPETWVLKLFAKQGDIGYEQYSFITDLLYDDNGNIYVSGAYGGWQVPSGEKPFIAKINTEGDVVWQKTISGTIPDFSQGFGLVIDRLGNLIQTITNYDNDNVICITKYDSETGDSIWSTILSDNEYYNDANGYNLDFTSDNNIVLAGWVINGDQTNQWKLYLAKLDRTDGSIIWQKMIGDLYHNSREAGMCVTSDDNIIVTGWGSMSGTDGNNAALIAKYNTDGDNTWYKVIRNENVYVWGGDLVGMRCVAGEDGGFFMVGSYSVKSTNIVTPVTETWTLRAGFISSVDADGTITWARQVSTLDGTEGIGSSVAYNNGKVYASFTMTQHAAKNNPYSDATFNQVVACFDAATGVLNYQNGFGPEAFYTAATQNGQLNLGSGENPGGKLLAVKGEYLALGGWASYIDGAEGGYGASTGFVAQLPVDGTTQDIAGWKFGTGETKIEYATFRTEPANWNGDPTTESGFLTSSTNNDISLVDADLTPQFTAGAANTWEFKADGDTVLPTDGNLEFARKQKGIITELGYLDHDNLGNYWDGFSSVAMDSAGNQYWVGFHDLYDNDDGHRPTVTKIDAEGKVQWQNHLDNGVQSYGTWNGITGYGQGIAIDPTTGNLVVVAVDGSEGNGDQMLIIGVDAQTGRKTVTENRIWAKRDDNDTIGFRPYDTAIDSTGNVFVAGQSQGNFTTLANVTVGPASGVGKLQVLKQQFIDAGMTAPNNLDGVEGWTISGTSISGYDGTVNDTTNVYLAQTPVTRQGTGAKFDVVANSGDPGVYTATVTDGFAGANYLVGHKIKILGGVLGGTDTVNDVILTVATVNAGAILTVTAAGTADGGAQTTYTALVGANYNVGSGATWDIRVVDETATYDITQESQGTNYVVGDILTFYGNTLGGNNSDNSIVLGVTSVGIMDGSIDWNYVDQITMPGASTAYTMLNVENSVDYSAPGTWDVSHNTGNDAVIMKLSNTFEVLWTKAIDNAGTDYCNTLAVDKDGNVVFGGRLEIDLNYNIPFFAKANGATGDLMWLRTPDSYEDYSYVHSLAIDSGNNIVAGITRDSNGGSWNPRVIKLAANGDQLWHQQVVVDGNEGCAAVAVDDDDNVYMLGWGYDGVNGNYEHASLFKMSTDGKFIWQRDVAQNTGSYLGFWPDRSKGGSRFLAANRNHVVFGGWKDDLDGAEGNAFSVKLPTDGTAIGNFGDWHITEETYYVDNRTYNNNTNDVQNIGLRAIQTQVDNSWDAVNTKQIYNPVNTTDLFSVSGAHIKFADGSVQDTSAQGMPQVPLRSGDDYNIRPEDNGKHIYVSQNSNFTIYLPENTRCPMPVGATITIVNWSGGTVYVRPGSYHVNITGSGTSDIAYGNYNDNWAIYDNGGGSLVTLLKIEQGDRNGEMWIISGANLSKNG